MVEGSHIYFPVSTPRPFILDEEGRKIADIYFMEIKVNIIPVPSLKVSC
jgi:hypothetical protein